MKEYMGFLESYHSETVTSAQVGEMIARMSCYYSAFVLEFVDADHAFNVRLADEEKTVDAAGKPISSAKAKSIADATPEAYKAKLLEGHQKAVECIISALKVLQYGTFKDQKFVGMS